MCEKSKTSQARFAARRRWSLTADTHSDILDCVIVVFFFPTPDSTSVTCGLFLDPIVGNRIMPLPESKTLSANAPFGSPVLGVHCLSIQRSAVENARHKRE